MSRWRRTKFDDIFIADCPSKNANYPPDVNHLFNYEPAREAFRCFKHFENSDNGDATVADIFPLDAVITATVRILRITLTRTDHKGTEQSLIGNCDYFAGGEEAVDCIEFRQGSQTNMTAKQTLY